MEPVVDSSVDAFVKFLLLSGIFGLVTLLIIFRYIGIGAGEGEGNKTQLFFFLYEGSHLRLAKNH